MNYVEEKMKEYAVNIDEFDIGSILVDSDKSLCLIINKTLNSIEVFLKAKTSKGIDCKQWFDMRQFNKRFKLADPSNH